MQPIAVDVICQHTRDGKLIPLRIRLLDEDGIYQIHKIHEYQLLTHQGTHTTADGVYITDCTLIFVCKIILLGQIKLIRLYYEPDKKIWRMTA